MGFALAPFVYVRGDEGRAPNTFRLWACSDAHVGTDLKRGRRSLAEAIGQSERPLDRGGFEWDIAVHLGDLSGNQGSPQDDEGEAVKDQLFAHTRHTREHVYNVIGNHDASGQGEPTQWWYRKWVDPAGESRHSGVNANKRPYPVEGDWERYRFRVGNLLFLMMSDRNDLPEPVGRGERGGYPAGAVTSETVAWWKANVEANPDSVIVSAHHHMLKETTVASGEWEGFVKDDKGGWKSHYHGYFPAGGPRGASYLYWVDDTPDAQVFERYLAQRPGAIDFWLGGHTHTNPDDTKGGRSHVERKWGVNFINCANLSRNHGRRVSMPMSRLLTFTDGSDEVRVRCYLHSDEHAAQGFYKKAERVMKIGKKFRM
jgi:hypothetical protein